MNRDERNKKNIKRFERLGLDWEYKPNDRNELYVVATLNRFEITYGHSYYFIVRGKMPLVLAEEIYATKIGKTDIRVGGHGGRVAPEHPWLDYYHEDGKKVIISSNLPYFQRILPDRILKYHFHDNPASFPAYVTHYHVDSELAMYILIQKIKEIE